MTPDQIRNALLAGQFTTQQQVQDALRQAFQQIGVSADAIEGRIQNFLSEARLATAFGGLTGAQGPEGPSSPTTLSPNEIAALFAAGDLTESAAFQALVVSSSVFLRTALMAYRPLIAVNHASWSRIFGAIIFSRRSSMALRAPTTNRSLPLLCLRSAWVLSPFSALKTSFAEVRREITLLAKVRGSLEV